MTRTEIIAKLVMAAGGLFVFWMVLFYRRHLNWRARG
jgi:hypothetical protein